MDSELSNQWSLNTGIFTGEELLLAVIRRAVIKEAGPLEGSTGQRIQSASKKIEDSEM